MLMFLTCRYRMNHETDSDGDSDGERELAVVSKTYFTRSGRAAVHLSDFSIYEVSDIANITTK